MHSIRAILGDKRMVITRNLGFGLAIVVAATTVSHADSDKLAVARKELEAIHYDKAQIALVAALHDGGNSPTAVAEIYRLSASTAIVLGQRDVADQYYRRWLAVDPQAVLPDRIAPKLREPFVAAQAYMAAHGRLVVKASRRSPTDLGVVVESDPLTMVATIAAEHGTPITLGADHHVDLHVAAGPTVVLVLDEYGNRLLELPVDAMPTIMAAQPPQQPPQPTTLGWYRTATPYVVAASVSLVGAFVIGSLANGADNDLQTALAGDHFASDAEEARTRRDRYALITNGCYIGAGLFTALAIVMIAARPHAEPVITPMATPASVGLAFTRTW